MSASKIKNKINKSDKKDISRSNTNMQINMSKLTSAQKQICLKLLAESNIMFSQEKDFFQAQLRINPLKFKTQINSEKKQTQDINKVSPIKKRQVKNINKNKKIQNPNKQNKLKQKNQLILNHDNQQQTKAKKAVQNLYASSKKPLSKCVKINSLSWLQQLHPQIQLYIYPKKLSFQSLCQQIQRILQKYWKSLSKCPSNLLSLPQFTYTHLIYHQQKSKTQQSLVNFIQTLNHYAYKSLGIQIFYNFFSGIWAQKLLNYYLVVRALLEQLYRQKIIQRHVTYNHQHGITYKIKLNPYIQLVQEEKIRYFLDVCYPQTISQQNKAQSIFKEMTEFMFFDQSKKKNYIHFHQMADILLRQFWKNQTVNGSDLQLCYTNNNSNLSDFLLESGRKKLNFKNDEVPQLQLTFQVGQQQETHIKTNDLNDYLPSQALNNVQLRPPQLVASFQQILTSKLFQKYKGIVESLGNIEVSQQSNSKSLHILQVLIDCLIHQDKEKWAQFLGLRQLTQPRLTAELSFIDNLIVECVKARNAQFISNQFLRKVLTASFLRQTIFNQCNIP